MSELDRLKNYAPIIINIQGEVSFSHISKMYEGEELIEANKRTQEFGGKPSNRPYCTLTLDNPRILNPETLPTEVVLVMQNRFKPSKAGVVRYYATSKSPNLPAVAYSAYAGPELAGQGIADKKHHLPHELDTGLTVTVGAKIFDTIAGVGIGFDYILIDEPIRYYESNTLAAALANQGVSYVAVAQTADTTMQNGMTRSVPNNAMTNAVDPSLQNTMQQPASNNAMVDPNAFTQAQQGAPNSYNMQENDGFMNIPDGIDEELPFDIPDEELPFNYSVNNQTTPVSTTMKNSAPQSNMMNQGAMAQAQGNMMNYGAATQAQGNMMNQGAATQAQGNMMNQGAMTQAQGNMMNQGAMTQTQGNMMNQGAMTQAMNNNPMFMMSPAYQQQKKASNKATAKPGISV